MDPKFLLNILSKKLKQAIQIENLGMIVEVGEELERYKIDINSLDRYDNGNTVLMVASKNKDPAMLNVLCELGADVNATGVTNNTALSYASALGNSECVIALCSKTCINPNITRTEPEYLGETPLMYACWKCTPEAVEALIACGAKVNVARQIDDRFTPLMYAINNHHGPIAARRIVDILLENDANIYALDSDGVPVFDHPRWEEVRIADPERPLNTANAYRAMPGAAAAMAAAAAAAAAMAAAAAAVRQRAEAAAAAAAERRRAAALAILVAKAKAKAKVAAAAAGGGAARKIRRNPIQRDANSRGGRRQIRRDTKKRGKTRRR